MHSIRGFSGRCRVWRRNLRQLAAVLCGSLLLLGCASRGGSDGSAPLQRPVSLATVAPDQDVLLHLLQGQFALQQGDRDAAATAFAKAAQLSPRAEIAALATDLAVAQGNWTLARPALARWQALRPGDEGQAVAQARLALGTGNVVDARRQLLALLQRDGRDAWRDVVRVLLSEPDRAQSAALLGELATPERLADDEQLWVAISQLAYRLGDVALATDLASQASSRLQGDDLDVWRARLALDDEDVATATRIYRQAFERDPQSLRIRMGYASLLSESGRHAEAARVLAAGKQNQSVYAARAAHAARADDKTLLQELYAELEVDTSVAPGARFSLLGQVAELLGRDDDALQWYRQISRDDEQWFSAQLRSILLQDSDDGGAGSALRLMQLRAEVVDDVDALGRTWLVEAELHQRRGDDAAAMRAYDSALAVLPGDTRILYARALAYIQAGHIDEGEQDLRAIIVQEPDNGEALNALGYTLVDRTTRLHEGLELITRALALRPGEAAIIDSLGWAYFRLGALDQAVVRLREALQKQPDAEIATHLGEALWAAGDREGARAAFAKARQLDADSSTLQETLQRLELEP